MPKATTPVSRRDIRVAGEKKRKRKIAYGITAGVCALALAGAGAVWAYSAILEEDQPRPTEASAESGQADPLPTPSPSPSREPAPTTPAEPGPEPEPEPEPVFDVDDPASVTVVVNKQRAIDPIEWAPSDLVLPSGIPNVWSDSLRAEATTALEQMYAAATEAGVPFTITSGYRDYWRQKSLYDALVAEGGTDYADLDTARPGHSEHQTGLAVDLYGNEGCALSACFGETATGIWLRDNAYRFGYILRYHDGEADTVGYVYEPWHFRYVGAEVSQAMHDQGVLNLEDFFGLPAAPNYG